MESDFIKFEKDPDTILFNCVFKYCHILFDPCEHLTVEVLIITLFKIKQMPNYLIKGHMECVNDFPYHVSYCYQSIICT